jgi:hypothetical protein
MMFKNLSYWMAILCLVPSYSMAMGNLNNHCTNLTNIKASGVAACDVSFTAIPTFSAICISETETGLYTIKNNSPVTIKINYIRIKSYDTLPVNSTIIIPAPTNNCGSTLAAGESCNILVRIKPAVAGTLNRVLQIGVDTRQVELDGPAITFEVCGNPPVPSPTLLFGPPIEGPTNSATLDCTVLAGSTVTNVPSVGTVVNGNVCVSPGLAATGFPPGIIVNGSLQLNSATAMQGQIGLAAAEAYVDAQTCNVNLTGQDLGGLTLTPGTYCFDSSAQLTGQLTLNGPGFYYFQIVSTLTTASNSSVVLIGGATSAQVFWDVDSSATLGTNTAFQGNILAQASITLNTGATLIGRALAQTAAVTLDDNSITP